MTGIGFVRSLAAASALALAIPAAGHAQVNVGAQVVDTSGNPVGTLVAIKGDNVMLKTDRHEVLMPKASFTPSEGKLLFAMTRNQVNTATDQALAAAAATVVVGAEVKGRDGKLAGTIEALEEDTVTLKTVHGTKVRLPRNGIGGTPEGPVLGVSVEELKAMTEEARAEAKTETGAESSATANQ